MSPADGAPSARSPRCCAGRTGATPAPRRRRTACISSASLTGTSGLHDRREAAEEHPLGVERHLRHIALQALVGHDLLVDLVARLARLVDDPREDDGLVVAGLDRAWERGHLALGNIVADALGD